MIQLDSERQQNQHGAITPDALRIAIIGTGEIAGMSDTFEKSDAANDAAACVLRFSGGTIATLHASWILRPPMENSLVLYGSSGIIRVPTEPQQPVRVAIESESGESKVWDEHVESNDPAGWMGATAAFVHAIENGRPSPVPGREGAAVIEAVDSAGQSILQREFIRL